MAFVHHLVQSEVVALARRGCERRESMLQVGQKAPILPWQDSERFVLIDGLHGRKPASKQLGETKYRWLAPVFPGLSATGFSATGA